MNGGRPGSGPKRSPRFAVSLAAAGTTIMGACGARPDADPANAELPPDTTALPLARAWPPETEIVSGPGERALPDHYFLTLEGDTVDFGHLTGSVVVANFWGTWCFPCLEELPELARVDAVYEDSAVAFVGISVLSGTADHVRTFLADFEVEYPQWSGDTDLALDPFGIIGLPHTLILDQEGWIRYELLGPQTGPELTDRIEAVLAEPAAGAGPGGQESC